MILLALGATGVLVIAAVLGSVLLAGGSDSDDDEAVKIRESGCTFQVLPAAPNLRFRGQRLRHVAALPKGFKYNSNPPTSGIHTPTTVIYGIYDEPVPAISSVHNLEHGGIVIATARTYRRAKSRRSARSTSTIRTASSSRRSPVSETRSR